MSNLYSDLDADTLRKLVIQRDEEIVKLKTNPLADPRFKEMIEDLWIAQNEEAIDSVCYHYDDSVSEYFDELAERFEDE